MTEEIEGQTNVMYDRMLGEYLASLQKDRIRALAQSKVIATKYNEALKVNHDLHKQLVLLQEELHHKTKELEKLKKRRPKNAKSKDISE